MEIFGPCSFLNIQIQAEIQMEIHKTKISSTTNDDNDDVTDVTDGRDDNDDVNEDVKRGAVLPPVLLTALLTVQMEPSIITHNGDDDVEE